jgi:acyl-coenzyme A thioesterase PaaI-like protein
LLPDCIGAIFATFPPTGMTSMSAINKLGRYVTKINSYPAWLVSPLLSLLFGKAIKFVGTASVKVDSLNFHQAVLSLANKAKVQNHIGTIHAAAMALLGESASGFLVGLHVADDRIPLLKSMQLNYVKRATGKLMATATLTDEQIQLIRNTEKGEITVLVQIKDELNVEPVIAEFVWAWVPKQRKESRSAGPVL